ncbi:MAG: hypothetical protein PHH37_09095 [Paludibacter sp.]|nr:hypothetical protein [Paludibacter sp.]
MKRIIVAISAILGCTAGFSQTMFDALKISDNDIIGTARYSSMAGAFGALGGDASAIKDNPAGLGIYRKSDISITGDALLQNTSGTWNGINTNDSKYKTGLDNLSLVLAFPTWRSESGYTGLLSSNFSFSYNKLKDFNRYIYAKAGAMAASITDYYSYFSEDLTSTDLTYVAGSYEPFNEDYVPWMSILSYEGYLINETAANSGKWNSLLNTGETVSPSYLLTETGGINQYSLSWAGNFSNSFYFGVSLNFQYIDYKAVSTYSEAFGAGGSMSIENTVTTKGSGVNFDLGAIYAPVDFMRFGASIHSPTFYAVTTENYSTLSSVNLNNRSSNMDYLNKYTISTPTGYVDYQVQTPLRLNLSAAFIIQDKGLISAEYVYNNYKGTKLMDKYGNQQDYTYDNQDIQDMTNNSRTIKIGGEYKVNDNVSLRAGYANVSAITKSSAVKYMIPSTVRTDPEYFLHNKTNYLTTGFGYRESSWYIDFAYMHKILDEDYYTFNDSDLQSGLKPANIITTNNNIVATFGLRF